MIPMLILMGLLLFPGLPIINSVVADTLADPSVSGSPAAPIIRLIPTMWVVGDIIGIPALFYMARNR